jgi:hypothetical protein
MVDGYPGMRMSSRTNPLSSLRRSAMFIDRESPKLSHSFGSAIFIIERPS